MEGNLEDAIVHYQRSLEIENTAEGHTFPGWAYSYKDRLDDAIEECHKAIDIDPDFGNPYNDIGSYLFQQGKFKEAIS